MRKHYLRDAASLSACRSPQNYKTTCHHPSRSGLHHPAPPRGTLKMGGGGTRGERRRPRGKTGDVSTRDESKRKQEAENSEQGVGGREGRRKKGGLVRLIQTFFFIGNTPSNQSAADIQTRCSGESTKCQTRLGDRYSSARIPHYRPV